MGVHGLWDLLAPVGRRVSVETLAGKRLAIDASIWMVQFMKAMRDDKGEMVRNAHLLGFFRRICKLLFLRTKPVFVFDGGTPTLKRRTVIARRRQRENAQAKIRKTAEKLFLNQMKAMRLSNLADNLKDQKGSSKGKEVMVEQSETFEKDNAALGVKNQGMLDEMLAASIVAEECGGFGFTASTPSVPCANASESASAAADFTAKDEDSDDDEEMMMPITDGNVDPAVLAALPPSMQLDLLVQMRERLMAENRQKYQKVKKAPQKFSELQIEAYLKTVAFRREIDEVQRAASGRAVGGVQTSRIASEANREFIFSSSFTGDKQALVSSGAENHSEKQQPPDKNESSSNIIDAIVASGSKADAEAGPTAPEVETYVDERGRKRIHRTRAMGIRMTRDLQRNIDLMKESEHASTPVDNEKFEQTERESAVRPSGISGSDGKFIDCPEKALLQAEAQKESLKSESSIKISFDNDDKPISMDDDDAFFTRLVAGSPPSIHSDNSSASDVEWEDGTSANPSTSLHVDNNQETSYSHAENPNNNESDLEWEEGSFHVGDHIELQETNTKNLEELEQPSVDVPKAVSKGSAEEEFALQEAIRRSLTDITGEMAVIESLDSRNSKHGLQLGSEGRQPILKMGEALTGIYQPQFFIIENDQSSGLAVKDAYAPGSISDKELDSAVNDARTVLRTSEGDTKLPKTSSENAEIGNLGNSGSFAPSVMGFNSLSSSLPVPLTNDITNEEVITGTSDFLTGHGALGTGLQKSCGDIQGKVVEDDIGFASVLERGHDVHITAPFDEGVSNELLGASLEDELLVLDKEFKDLENEQKKLERNADSVNSEMFVECQELLQMFGLPYIIAPMEAEAQCAFLEFANLVDGVVTDDSDVFLFGAQSVFKNIFDDRKYVETYLLKDIESELGLNTEKLICMALLLESDYTEGVSGVGIVNAIEVVNAFPEEDGLQKFREWVESPDPTILGLRVKKNGSKVTSAADCSTSEANEDTEATDSRKRKEIFMNKHRNVSKNWQFPVSFPSDAVIAAYKSPQVDKSAEPFGWGKPDIFSLRRLCSEKFAWANQKADELLLPVLKEYNKHETQLRLEAFYSFNERFANIRSKRIRQAVKGITGKRSLPDASDLQELPKHVTKRGENTSNKSNKERKDDTGEMHKSNKERKDDTGEMHNSSKKKSSKSKSKKSDAKHEENTRQIIEEEDTRMGGTGCSRARGNSGKSIRKGRRMESSDSELDNTIFSSDEREQALQSGNEPLHRSVRRSKRSRKVTSYEEKDDESDELIKSPTRSSLKCRNNETRRQNSFECEDVHKVDLTGCGSQQEVTSDGDGYGDYLARGGGFCADEDNAESLSNETVSFQSKGVAIDDNGDYLQMGGGFCTDDPPDVNLANLVTDVDVNTSERHKSTYVDPSEEHKSTDNDITDSVNQSEGHKPIEVDRSRVAKNVRDYDVTASANAFSAIPFLKRKKRKK